MYLDVITGSTSNPAALQQLLDRWANEVAPGIRGWRGTTAGVTADGTFAMVSRIEDEVPTAAGPEKWRTALIELLGPDPSSGMYDRVTLLEETEGVARAGFVQFTLGRVENPPAADRYLQQFDEVYAPLRPDMIGRLMARRDDGEFFGAFYFTSQEQARAGEAQQVSPEIAEMMQRGQELSLTPGAYLDLTSPWIYRPAAALTGAASGDTGPMVGLTVRGAGAGAIA